MKYFISNLLTASFLLVTLISCTGVQRRAVIKNLKKVQEKGDFFIATVEIANDAYQVYVDCHKGIVNSRDNKTVPLLEKANIVSDVCKSLASNSPISPSPTPIATLTPFPQSYNCIGINYSFHPEFKGGFVNNVENGMPAKVAGLRQGDVIKSVNNQPVTSLLSIQLALSTLKVSDFVDVYVMRPSFYQITNQSISISPLYTNLKIRMPMGKCFRNNNSSHSKETLNFSSSFSRSIKFKQQ